jgi:PKD repeat protein
MTIGISLVAVLAIAIILLAPNITITNAQQQEPLISRPPTAVSQNGTRLVEDAEDSFRLQVPEGWIIHDVNNTGSILSEESTQGYGILAQLCPQEQQQQQRAALPNAGGNSSRTFNSCDQSENDIIHIVRYPDLDNRLQVGNNGTTANNNNMTIDNILLYHMQKLGEVGYRGIEIVNSTDTTLNVTDPQTNQTITIVPAKFVEMTYSTVSAPNEIREGYFILTATKTTAPNPGMTKGYSIFYEGTSTAAGAATAATIQKTTTTTAASVSLAPIIPPAAAAVQQIFDSFELIAAQEVVQDMLAAQSEQAQQQDVVGEEEEEEPTSSPLRVEITSSETEGGRVVAPATFEFEADVAGVTEPYTYSWDFDDDGGSSSEERSDDDETISHTFEEAGRYNVRLTVTDSIGQRASDSVQITVEEAPSPPPTIREPPAQGEDVISEDSLPPQQAQPDSSPPTAPTEKIPAEQPTAQGNNQGGEQGETTIAAPNLTQSIQQEASQNTQVGIPNSNQGGEATTEPNTSSLDFDDNGASSSEERSDDDDDENVDHIFDERGSHNDGDRTVTDSEDQRVSDSIEDIGEAPPEEPQEEEPSTQEIPAEQPTAEEVKPDLSDADNNSGADDLIDVDDLFDVDEFIDDLFVKLGLDN